MIFSLFIYHSSLKKTTFVTIIKRNYHDNRKTDNLAGIRHAVWNLHGIVLDFQIHLPPHRLFHPVASAPVYPDDPLCTGVRLHLCTPLPQPVSWRQFFFHSGFQFLLSDVSFASILTALAHYVYFRFIDQGYLLNTYLDQLENIKDSVTGDMKISVEQLIGSLNVISSLSSLQLTFQLLSQNFFYGILLAIPTGLVVMKKKN